MTEPVDEFATWDAAYVLGALAPADRRRFEHHLDDCAHCRESVAELAGVPGMLALVPRDTALAMLDDEPETDPAPADLLPASRPQRSDVAAVGCGSRWVPPRPQPPPRWRSPSR